MSSLGLRMNGVRTKVLQSFMVEGPQTALTGVLVALTGVVAVSPTVAGVTLSPYAVEEGAGWPNLPKISLDLCQKPKMKSNLQPSPTRNPLICHLVIWQGGIDGGGFGRVEASAVATDGSTGGGRAAVATDGSAGGGRGGVSGGHDGRGTAMATSR
nr:hypothetical protein Iba_chr04aCG16520 [Ipomoea batatas]